MYEATEKFSDVLSIISALHKTGAQDLEGLTSSVRQPERKFWYTQTSIMMVRHTHHHPPTQRLDKCSCEMNTVRKENLPLASCQVIMSNNGNSIVLPGPRFRAMIVDRNQKTLELLWPKSLYFGCGRQDILVDEESWPDIKFVKSMQKDLMERTYRWNGLIDITPDIQSSCLGHDQTWFSLSYFLSGVSDFGKK